MKAISGKVIVSLTDRLSEFDATNHRHIHIDEHRIEGMLRKQAFGFFRTACGAGDNALWPQVAY